MFNYKINELQNLVILTNLKKTCAYNVSQTLNNYYYNNL